MNIINNSKATWAVLLLIVVLAAFLRLHKLDQVPPSLSWDEAANGYNAYTIANWGKDEWGKSFPVYFKSFEDDKNPVHIYLTAIPVRIMGLSEFSTRLAPAVFGVFSVIVLFFLANALFSGKIIGLIASFSLAISPYALQFSRFNHESTFALFFFLFGLLMFFLGIKGKPKLLIISFLSFGIDLLTSHSAKVVVPPMLLLLIMLYFKQLWKYKSAFIAGIFCLVIILSLFIFNPELLGTARMKQTSLPEDVIKSTRVYEKTHNELLARTELAGQRYLTYFSFDFLFQSGDAIARHSTGAVGEFYKTDLVFLVIGLISLILLRSKIALVVLVWAFLAPVPAAASGGLSETGHAGRALYMMGGWHLIAALGYYRIISFWKNYWLKSVLLLIIVTPLIWEFKEYINYYYGEYARRYAIEWQYGMKQAAEYIKDHNGYTPIYMTDARSQPYIYFLYYLNTPLPKFLETVYYNNTKSRPSNLVTFFDNYHFGDWDPIESFPHPGVMYILTPSQYDGLRYKNEFQVKKLIKYPNSLDAFFLVSYP